MNLPLLALISVATSSIIWCVFMFAPVLERPAIVALFVSPFAVNLAGLLMLLWIGRKSMTVWRWLGAIAFSIVAPLIMFFIVGIVEQAINGWSMP